ncbi:MAG: PASTA domain-containing protein [Bacteroidota bacterium]|nr:PASTA domain-containing protein [Bacteroidota bacterium]
MDFFRFLASKKFLKNFAWAIVLSILFMWIVMLILRVYTRHESYYTVPDFSGKTVDDLTTSSSYRNFEFVVIDSIYDPEKPKGTVLNQDPLPKANVKSGRKIYLTIVSIIPEKTVVPDLKSLTLRQAINTLTATGFKIGHISYVQSFDADAVQQQMFNGKVLTPGTKLEKGSLIDLSVGMGSRGKADVPASSTEASDSL